MTVKVIFECGGCDATAKGSTFLRKRFLSFSGQRSGFGGPVWETTVDDVVPEGWVAFDPYTYACYCPKCWASIEGDESAHPAKPPLDHPQA